MLNPILNLDQLITTFLYQLLPHNFWLALIFSFFSQKGNAILIWIVILVIVSIKEEMEDKRFIIYFGLAFLLAAFLSQIVLKNLFLRPRPLIAPNNSCPRDYSFPSSHAATAFAAAYIFSRFDKKRRYFYYAISSLIAFSRIYLSCHFFFDVVAGGLIGTSIGYLLLLTIKKPINKS